MLRQDNGQIFLDGYCQVDEGYGNGEHYEQVKSGLSWLPISSRGYLLCRVALSSFLSQLSRCRRTIGGGVSDLDTVILNPKDSQYVKATYIHVWNTTALSRLAHISRVVVSKYT